LHLVARPVSPSARPQAPAATFDKKNPSFEPRLAEKRLDENAPKVTKAGATVKGMFDAIIFAFPRGVLGKTRPRNVGQVASVFVRQKGTKLKGQTASFALQGLPQGLPTPRGHDVLELVQVDPGRNARRSGQQSLDGRFQIARILRG
jgi:hypothetical protein